LKWLLVCVIITHHWCWTWESCPCSSNRVGTKSRGGHKVAEWAQWQLIQQTRAQSNIILNNYCL